MVSAIGETGLLLLTTFVLSAMGLNERARDAETIHSIAEERPK
jgi:hypothetical protein